MKQLSVIQHTSAEYLGLMEDHFEGRRIRFKYFRPFTEGTPLPHPDAVGDGLILLGGGPWGSAWEGSTEEGSAEGGGGDLPTLKEEIRLAVTCLMLEKPVIGIGLGAQILAIAAGGGSEKSDLTFSVGTATCADAGALNGFLPAEYPLITYMRDRPVPPKHALILAKDDVGRAALFQIGGNAFGFSGHPGIKPAIIEDLIMEFQEGPDEPGPGLEALRAATPAIENALIPIMTGLIQMTGLMQ